MKTFLVGRVAGTWRDENGKVELELFEPVLRAERRKLDDEARRLEASLLRALAEGGSGPRHLASGKADFVRVSATSSISGAQRQARSAMRGRRSSGTLSASSHSATPYARAIACAWAVRAIPILFQPPKAIFSAEAGAELGVERDRIDVRVLEEPDDRLTLLAGEVEVDSRRGEDRAVDDTRPEPADPAYPLGRDRVGLHEDALEAEPEDLLGHLLGDRRRTDAEDQVARTDELLDRADVLEGGGPAVSSRRFLLPSLAQTTSARTALPTAAPI